MSKNEQITEKVQIIGEDGKLGEVITLTEAEERAEELGLDLLKLAEKEGISLCKIQDSQKYEYRRKKSLKKSKQKTKTQKLKEIRLGVNIGEHDLQVKVNNIDRIITSGDRVKVTVQIKGRVNDVTTRKGFELLEEIQKLIGCSYVVDKAPTLEGRNIVMYLK